MKEERRSLEELGIIAFIIAQSIVLRRPILLNPLTMIFAFIGSFHSIQKRRLWNFGRNENNPRVDGDLNQISIGVGPAKVGQETLLRKSGHQLGRGLEGGSDFLVAPTKWINHMQDIWYGIERDT
jgi:hypothetical protein